MKFSKKVLYLTLGLGGLVILVGILYSSQVVKLKLPNKDVAVVSKQDLLDTSNWKTWRNSDGNFTFKYPSTFVEGERSSTYSPLLFSPRKLTIEEIPTESYILITADVLNTDPAITKTLPFNKDIKNQIKGGKDVLLSGIPAYIVEVRDVSDNDSVVSVMAAVQLNPKIALRFDIIFRKLPYDKKLADTFISTIQLKR